MEAEIKNKIMSLVRSGATYKEIQLGCGNPSKAQIRNTIKELDPDLYKIVSDTKALKEYRDSMFNKSIN